MTTLVNKQPALIAWALVLGLAGCVPSQNVGKEQQHFETEPLDAALVIVVDMSGSFADSWESQAYDLFLELMDQFFTQAAVGNNTRVVIGQLSGNDNVMLFEGRPQELRSQFQSPGELNQFLRDNADTSSSGVFKATGAAVDYAASMHGVGPETRLLTVIMSDMIDSEVDPESRTKEGRAMLSSLKTYAELGGGVAIYYAAPTETKRWNQIFTEAGFKPGSTVIQNTLIAEPQLPRFD